MANIEDIYAEVVGLRVEMKETLSALRARVERNEKFLDGDNGNKPGARIRLDRIETRLRTLVWVGSMIFGATLAELATWLGRIIGD